MADSWISILISVLKGVAFIVDVVTYLPFYILNNPKKRLSTSQRIKAKRVIDDDPSSAYRSIDSFDHLTVTPFPECQTIDDVFERAVYLFGDRHCLGTRQLLSEEDEIQPNGKIFKKDVLGDYDWLSYEQVRLRATNFGGGLLSLGQRPRDNICIFTETRAEWIIAALACFKFNFPVTTLYSTLGDEAIVHGINETDVTFVITSIDLLPKFKLLLPQLGRVEFLVYVDEHKLPKLDGFPASVAVHSMAHVEEIGASPNSISSKRLKPEKDDIALIMYTSGSTGLPKGVMISHGNLLSGMSGQAVRVPSLSPQDTYIGYLPLAHVLELAAEMVCLSHGVRIGFSSPNTLTDQSTRIKKGCKGDASVLRPTLMAAVPEWNGVFRR